MQPSNKDYNYDATAKMFGSRRIRKMDYKWYGKWKWLSFCRQRRAVFCARCVWMSRRNMWPPGSKPNEFAFTVHGFSSWQVATGRFNIHQESEAHRAAEDSWNRRAQVQPSAAAQVDTQLAMNQRSRSGALYMIN
jgi:hypothetical protein